MTKHCLYTYVSALIESVCEVIRGFGNGQVAYSYKNGITSASFSCYAGYNLIGAQTITCEDDEWSAPQPECRSKIVWK